MSNANPLTVTIKTTCYNDRRYGKPWIARVDFAADPNGKFEFGRWIGQIGEAGELQVPAQPGDVIATGQKDGRASKYSDNSPKYQVVQADGTLGPIIQKIEALGSWRSARLSPQLPAAPVVSTEFCG